LLDLTGLAASSECATVPAGLLSWWAGEGNGNDQSGLNGGSLYGGISFASGKVGSAFSFNGINGHIRIPDSPSLHFTNALTMEAWVYPTRLGVIQDIICKWDLNGTGQKSYDMALLSDGRAYLILCADGNDGFDTAVVSTNAVPLNQWTHLATSYDSTSIKIYVNGSYQTEVAYTHGIFPGNHDLGIGGTVGGSDPGQVGVPFAGLIDEPSIYSRALSAAEILEIYNAGSTGKCGSSIPPTIISQPDSHVVTVGGTCTFQVVVSGTAPLNYQWTFEGTSIFGATDNVLTLSNLQTNQTGNYKVLVTNSFGSVSSSTAVLTVLPLATNCIAPPSGLVSWWKGDGNGADSYGSNDGFLLNGANFGTGEVGQGFSFNSAGSAVHIPASDSLDVGAGNGFTVETWINPMDVSRGHPIFEWNSGISFGVCFWVANWGSSAIPGSLFCDVKTDSLQDHAFESAGGLLTTNVFQHVAFTYDKTSEVAAIYLNGLIVTQKNIGTLRAFTSTDAYIGYRVGDGGAGSRFNGTIDELTLYNRALGQGEIQKIVDAGMDGKCLLPGFPIIISQPANRTATLGGIAEFTVAAKGTAPFSYQWRFGTNIIQNATNSILTLSNVQPSMSGLYSVTVENTLGIAVSSNAMLTVVFPTASVRLIGTNAQSGTLVTIPLVLTANGNENALGFSINFNPSLLTFDDVTLDSNLQRAVFFVNTNQAATGRLGIAISLPSGSTFTPGDQPLGLVNFTTAITVNGTSAAVSFGDQPVLRQLADPDGNTVPMSFGSAVINILPVQFEADLSPRPNGNQSVTITDWVLLGRYAARLDFPTNASEFQRADCAPRGTLGDGQITVSDWVQAGRYAVNLDPLTPAGGPDSLNAGGPTYSGNIPHKHGNELRQLSFGQTILLVGQPSEITVNLNSIGNENAIGFSVNFDPSLATFDTASLGSSAGGGSLNVNATQASNGRVGLVLALPFGSAFNKGPTQPVKLKFHTSLGPTGDLAMAFTDQPVPREVSDIYAGKLPTEYLNASLAVKQLPSLKITSTGEQLLLSWPLWASNFVVQELPSTLSSTNWASVSVPNNATNGENMVILSISNQGRFYRLRN